MPACPGPARNTWEKVPALHIEYSPPALVAGWDLNQFLRTNTVIVATFPFLGSSCGLMRDVVCSWEGWVQDAPTARED